MRRTESVGAMRRKDGALLVVRVVLGLIFLTHGAQKVFGAFGGGGFHGTAVYFAHLGLHPGLLFALLSAGAEFGGGLLILVGLLTPLGGLLIAVDMVVAIATVTGRNGFFVRATAAGFEFNLALLGMALALLVAGGGAYSVDHMLPYPARGLQRLSRTVRHVRRAT